MRGTLPRVLPRGPFSWLAPHLLRRPGRLFALLLVAGCAPSEGPGRPAVDAGPPARGQDPAAPGEPADAAPLAERPFTLAVLPDTQHYVEWWRDNTPVLLSQTAWIAEHAAAQNILLVTQLGDVVENGAIELEWRRAARGFDLLHGVVPYSTLPGNHDFQRKADRSSGTPLYRKYFGAARYGGAAWTTLGPRDRNSYQTFRAAGRTFLHIALEWEADDAVLAWAQQVIDAHPGAPTIVSTHAFLNLAGQPGIQRLNPGGNSGRDLWQKLVSVNDQVFIVLGGHYGDVKRAVLLNERGRRVFAMTADYSFDHDDGGAGYLRLLEIDPAADEIRVTTFSPWLRRSLDGPRHRFAIPFSLDSRFGPP